MPYDTPTPADLKTRFPAFAGVADPAITMALGEAQGRVDRSWPERDYQPALLLYTAHILTLDGQGAGTEAEIARSGAGGFQRMRSGSLELDRGTAAASTGAGADLDQTSYGRRFREMVRRNFPPVLVV
jgi:hypothetical protein